MFLDIITAAILVICAARGLSKGFVSAFFNALGWIGAFIASIFLTRPLASFLSEGWLGTLIGDILSVRFDSSQRALDNVIEGLPDIISGGISSGVDSASELAAGLFASLIISLISFVIVFFAAGFLLKLIVKPASKRHGGGVLDAADRGLGLVAGLIEGLVIVFFFLVLLVIIVNISWTGLSELIVDMIQNSIFTETLYDNNLMLLVTGGLFS